MKIPAVTETAFNCPHCGVLTTQYWYKVFVAPNGEEYRLPNLPNQEIIDEIKKNKDIPAEQREKFLVRSGRMLLGKPFIESSKDSPLNPPKLYNCNISSCYNCKEPALWVHDKLVYPNEKIDIQPNQDMPENVKVLFDEAREIVSGSPRGAAALLRLSIQYLCIELGKKGNNLDADIASLVTKGLNPVVQKSLDVLRVIGNNSVHPGKIYLEDQKATAIELFSLVNIICEQMISQPKKVEELFDRLPEEKKDYIEKRNEKSGASKST